MLFKSFSPPISQDASCLIRDHTSSEMCYCLIRDDIVFYGSSEMELLLRIVFSLLFHCPTIRATRAANELIQLKLISFEMSLLTLKHSLSKYVTASTYKFYNLNNSCSHFSQKFSSFFFVQMSNTCVHFNPMVMELGFSFFLLYFRYTEHIRANTSSKNG